MYYAVLRFQIYNVAEIRLSLIDFPFMFHVERWNKKADKTAYFLNVNLQPTVGRMVFDPPVRTNNFVFEKFVLD